MVIDADCLLANILQSREQVTVQELNEVRSNIERLVPGVYVDVAKNCVVWAINQRPEMFNWTDQVIHRCKEWPQSYVDEFFNWRIPSDVRARVLEAIHRNFPQATELADGGAERVPPKTLRTQQESLVDDLPWGEFWESIYKDSEK